MSNLITRAITGLIFVTVVLGSILWNEYAAAAVLGGFMLLALFEFYGLFKESSTVSPQRESGAFVGLLIFGIFFCSIFDLIPEIGIALIFPALFLLVLVEIWRKKEQPIVNVSVGIFGIVYLAIPFTLMIFLNRYDSLFGGWSNQTGQLLPLLGSLFVLVWTNDTFAYITGRVLGRTKLFERISPNKTWEGTIGGIVFTCLVGFLFSIHSANFEDTLFWIVGGFVVALGSIFGDLIESLFKRSLNIKDSGTLLPGHGGILDRFDAVIFATPFFMAWIFLNDFLN